jgi:serine phosphatase RsbU (regulator of sigma subunit)
VKARVRTHLLLREAHETLARQLVAINNELEMARQIQLAILPKETPKIEGLEIAARYIPMSSVAGDFYDFIVVDEKHVGILIADVSGHGLPSALIASMLQSAFAAQSAHASDPVRVLSELNRALFGKFRSHFVTAAYLFLDLEKRAVNYAGAGHPPVLWRKSSGSVTEVLENGFFLGPFHDSTYSAVPLSLEGGDRVILYTDGIVEAKNSSGEEFGMDRFKGMVEETMPCRQIGSPTPCSMLSHAGPRKSPEQASPMTLPSSRSISRGSCWERQRLVVSVECQLCDGMFLPNRLRVVGPVEFEPRARQKQTPEWRIVVERPTDGVQSPLCN